MNIFGSILTTFESSSIYGGCLGSIENWVKPKNEPPSGDLAWPNPWNALYKGDFNQVFVHNIYSWNFKRDNLKRKDDVINVLSWGCSLGHRRHGRPRRKCLCPRRILPAQKRSVNFNVDSSKKLDCFTTNITYKPGANPIEEILNERKINLSEILSKCFYNTLFLDKIIGELDWLSYFSRLIFFK